MLIPLAAGLLFFFPGLLRGEIEFRYQIDEARCVDRLELRVFEGDILARSHGEPVGGRSEITHLAKLKHGEYRAIVSLQCSDGDRVIASRQPIIVDRDGVIQFKVSGAECRCSAQ